MQGSRSRPHKMSSAEDLMGCIKPQPLRCTLHEEKEGTYLRKSKSKGRQVAKWVHQRQEAAIKGFQLVLFLILLGIRMQFVKGVEEISIHQEWTVQP